MAKVLGVRTFPHVALTAEELVALEAAVRAGASKSTRAARGWRGWTSRPTSSARFGN